MSRNVKLITVLLLSLFSACENNSSDSITAKLRFALDAGAKTGAIARKARGEGLMVDTAVLHLQGINLLVRNQAGQVTNSANPPFAGPYTIDLIYHKSIPVIESSSVNPGEYCGIHAGLFIPANNKFSFYVSGTYTLDDKWWRFIYTNSGSGSFQVTDSAAFLLDETNSDIWIIIDVVKLFSGVEFGKAVVDNDNIIRINETSNASLALIVQDNFRDSSAVVSNAAPASGSDSGNTPGQSAGSNTPDTSTNQSSDNENSASQGSNNSSNSGSVSNNDKNPSKDKNKEDGQDKNNKDKNKDKGPKSKPDHKDNSQSKNKNKQH